MATFSQRPPALAHVSDETAARALGKCFGDFRRDAEDLKVDYRDLRRLTWSNPGILTAAHERQSLFASIRRDEIMRGLMSKAASVRWRAVDQMFTNPALFGPFLQHPLAPATVLGRVRPRKRGLALLASGSSGKRRRSLLISRSASGLLSSSVIAGENGSEWKSWSRAHRSYRRRVCGRRTSVVRLAGVAGSVRSSAGSGAAGEVGERGRIQSHPLSLG